MSEGGTNGQCFLQAQSSRSKGSRQVTHMAAADKEKNGGKKPGTPDTGAAAQDKDPVGFGKFSQAAATKPI